MEKNEDFKICFTDSPIIYIDEDEMFLDIKDEEIREMKRTKVIDDLETLLETIYWRYDEDGLYPVNMCKISRYINELNIVTKFLNENGISWRGGILSFTELEDVPDDEEVEEDEETGYFFISRIGYFIVTKVLITLNIMDYNGKVIRQEYPIHVNKDRL
jgi:hypothetical protein